MRARRSALALMLVAALAVGTLAAVAPSAVSSARAETAASTISGTTTLRDGADTSDLTDTTIVPLGSDEPLTGVDIEPSDVTQFTSTPVPLVSGTPSVGHTLTGSIPEWSPSDAAFSYQWNRSGTAIDGATSPNYSIVEADVTTVLTLTVTGTKLDYVPVSQTSAPSAAIAGVWAQTTAPAISGEATVGKTLTASAGAWSPEATYGFQWLRAGVKISGAAAASYTLTAADLGKQITVTMTGTKPGYASVSKTSAATPAVRGIFTTTVVPKITGTVAVGQTLTASVGAWAPAATFGYQWLRAGVKISGAAAPTYKLTAADLGKQITVSVTGATTGYVSASKTSAATSAVQGVFTTAVVPKIAGTLAVGQTLTASAGAWSPAASFGYQWLRSGAKISGATASSYKLTAADMGKQITVTVTGSKAGYVSASKASASSVAVLNAFTTAPTPKITGSAKSGQTLTASAGTWAPAAALTYQWLRSGVAVAGATKSSYVLGAADLGRTMTVVVTGKKTGYLTVPKTSAKTAAVVAVFAKAPTPTIGGTAQSGNALTAATGTWSPAATLSYQWKRSGVAIAGATGKSYVLKPTDVDGAFTVTVTATKSNYVTVAKTSAATKSVVGLKYANCTALNAAYPHGVAKPGTRHDMVSGVAKPFKGTPFYSASVYALNPSSDRDKDGIACER